MNMKTGEETGYRHPRFLLVVGTVCALIFLVMGVGSTVGAYWNVDGSFPQPKWDAAVMGLVFGGMTLLSIYIVMKYYRGRLFLEDSQIRKIGCFSSHTMLYADVTQAVWWCGGNLRGLKLRGYSGNLGINFGDYTMEDANEIVGRLRERIPLHAQTGWEQFANPAQAKRVANPKLARRILLFITLVFFLAAIFFAYAWQVGVAPPHGTRGGYLGLAVVNAVVGLVNLVFAIWFVGRKKAQP
ncbi:MAG TPA: hypothetical protein VK737_04160 [Opitutales bacterium]|jgi:hypothetical protein|nr:hypothetical protein [Opitutales bacterium]